MATRAQPCNYAALLGAVFGAEPAEVLRRWGFGDGLLRCECGAALSKQNQSGYCSQCRWERSHILMVCDECGGEFHRRAGDIVQRIGRGGYQHVFCGRVCMGRYQTRHYGWAAHPENRGSKPRIHDWDAVWAAHLETGYGAGRLSRLLGIPKGTVSVILWRKRAEAMAKDGGA